MERRKRARRKFSYYMRVLSESTGELVGHLADISPGGFKLECQKPIPAEADFTLRIELTEDIADKQFMIFAARSKWCRPDPIDPTAYNVGFQIVRMVPGDLEIFTRMFEKYGAQSGDNKSDYDYLWK